MGRCGSRRRTGDTAPVAAWFPCFTAFEAATADSVIVVGFQPGDGTLRYGAERITEMYYRYRLSRSVQVTPDLQYIANPGFNRDRGPAKIIGLRVRIAF